LKKVRIIMATATARIWPRPDTLRLATSGDGLALNDLVRELVPHIERQLLRYPVADEDRRDLLQTTLMQVVRRLGSFRGDSSFSTWLFRVTANEALMLMRSQRRQRARVVGGLDLEDLASLPAMNDANAEERSDVLVSKHERDAQVRGAVANLPEDYRDVVLAHYNEDLGLQEIADRLDLTESAVRSRLHRARTRLRQVLAPTTVGAEAREDAALVDRKQARKSTRNLPAAA
jgi:RNA polymerase sigma-70 factor (ECF subfamily)